MPILEICMQVFINMGELLCCQFLVTQKIYLEWII